MREYLFAKGELRQVLEASKQRIRKEIQELPRDYILGVSEADLCSHLVDEYSAEAPTIRRDEISALDPDQRGIQTGHPACQRIPGIGVDKAMSHVVLDAVTPAALDVTLEVFDELRTRKAESTASTALTWSGRGRRRS